LYFNFKTCFVFYICTLWCCFPLSTCQLALAQEISRVRLFDISN